MRRRVTGLAAAATALGMAAALTACGGSDGSSGVTLRLVAADYGDSAANSSKKYWASLVQDFEKDHPDIHVDVDVLSWNDVDSKLKEMVDAGDPPDIAQAGSYADYAAAHKLYSADDLLSIPVQADFLPSLTDAGEVGRVQYGLPFVSSTRLLFYNKTLFDRAGIDRAPRSWDELAEDAATLKDQGVKIPYALPLGPEEAQGEALMWLLSGGDGYTDSVGGYSLDSQQNIDTFDWLKKNLVGKGLTGPTPPAELNRADAFAAFTKGQVGMLNGHPTLMQMADKQNVRYGMVPMPGAAGPSKATMGVADWMMAFKEGGHRSQVGTFLDFVYDKRNTLDFCRAYDLLPVTTSASEAMAADKSEKNLAPFLEELPSSQLYPVGKTSWSAVSAGIKKQIGKAVGPHASPRAILEQLQRAATTEENATR